MKFTRKKEIPLKIGDVKEEINFAFFPVRINKETVIWWEKYITIYKAERHLRTRPLVIGTSGMWLDWDIVEVVDWVEKERRLIT